MDCRACVKSRYDGRGLECAKMGKGCKGRQGTGAKVIMDGRERLKKGGGVHMGKERGGSAEWIQERGMATGGR